MSFERDCIVEKRYPGCDWVLMRTKGDGLYFFIWCNRDCQELKGFPMLHLSSVSRNFFQCRSLAVRMYDAFVSGLP